ncbi:MbnP family copper-binding protein [Novosphingobium sp. KACC 22771]|uniref:MbnP family copper-binding protein n=1 Tax=Novosphingobium sp. KACC 22771 TaxID=3025670 RepID=UPI0023671F67|nr:MbnP family copper-binding protein [Novosphingobium sp. KACC 22771]WDF70932.1 metallo-mystery pair system four-Cys motif protein [Novosphingobium sp. KACC 22771]
MRLTPLIAAATLVGSAAQAAPAPQHFSIPFAAEIAGKPFTCSAEYRGLGKVPAVARVGDFRLYISEVALIRKDGAAVPLALDQDGQWQYKGVALIDFEDGTANCANGTSATNTTLRGTAPKGDYTGIAFTVGVPFELNHGDVTQAPPPLNMTSMAWAWQLGFRFWKIELSSLPDPIPAPSADPFNPLRPSHWSIHLGSTECASASVTTAPKAPCANPNRIAVRLTGFDPAKGVVIDPTEALAESNLLANTPRTSSGCMSFVNDPDCAPLFYRLGLPFNGVAPGAQKLVKAR